MSSPIFQCHLFCRSLIRFRGRVVSCPMRDDSRLTTKLSVKLAVVERSIHNIGRDVAPASKDDVSKLDKFLNTDD
jgi:hypothetical protein